MICSVFARVSDEEIICVNLRHLSISFGIFDPQMTQISADDTE